MSSDSDLEYFEQTPIVHIVTTNDRGEEVITPIWAVVSRGHVYIRNGHGPESKWFGRVLRGHGAEFDAGDRRIPAAAEPVFDPDTLERVDDAYREKYASAGEALDMMLSAGPRGDTLQITPKEPRHPATGQVEHQ